MHVLAAALTLGALCGVAGIAAAAAAVQPNPWVLPGESVPRDTVRVTTLVRFFPTTVSLQPLFRQLHAELACPAQSMHACNRGHLCFPAGK